MSESNGTPGLAEGRSLLRSLSAVVAGTFGFLAIIGYPLGLIAYWIQMWRDYTHDATVALYAASLVPVPVATGRALGLLPVIVVVAVLAMFSMSFTHQIRVLTYYVRDTTQLTGLRRLLLSRAGKVFSSILALSIAATLVPLNTDLIPLNGTGDVLFYLCAVAVAGGGGELVSRILARNLERNREIWETVDAGDREEIAGREFLSAGLRAGATLASTAIITALFLIPLQSPPLANVTFSGAVDCQAKLISHSQGYWYVIKNGDRSVTAIPNSTAGTANISMP